MIAKDAFNVFLQEKILRIFHLYMVHSFAVLYHKTGKAARFEDLTPAKASFGVLEKSSGCHHMPVKFQGNRQSWNPIPSFQNFAISYARPSCHIEAWTKWPPFSRWHFQTCALEWNVRMLIEISQTVLPTHPIDDNSATLQLMDSGPFC